MTLSNNRIPGRCWAVSVLAGALRVGGFTKRSGQLLEGDSLVEETCTGRKEGHVIWYVLFVCLGITEYRITDTRVFDLTNRHMGMMDNTPGFSMEERDPNNINLHLQVMWDDVIAEPEGIASRDCTWRTSYKCFRGAKHCCYRFLACLLGPCLACCLGCQFACLAFQHIWCNTPCLRQCKINCNFIRALNRVCAGAILAPCFDVCGTMFQRIRVRHGPMSEEDTKEQDLFTV
ncbi:Caveolin-1 [Amphibalanus amphitrite]|uniref:Caveolin n=1 Tax=Amphibalanus amphitrite TaxID=1232801 RepID=A0A6A4VB84_AMPAM|nr:Caveolin-1 [Amphibalanus amphitrite]